MEKTREEYLRELKEEYEKKMLEINTQFDLQKDINKIKDDYMKYDDDYEDEGDSYDLDDTIEIEPRHENEFEEQYEDYISSKPKKSKWRTVLIYIILFILPIFGSLSVISTHTHYLVRKPFNYVCMGLSGGLFIFLIVLLIVNIVKRDKSKSLKGYIISNLIMALILGIIDIIGLFLLVKKRAWGLMNYFIAHYKLVMLIMFIILILIIGLLIIIKVKKRKIKSSVKTMFLNFIVCVYVLCFMDGMLVLYHSQSFREWLVTTAMQTMHHQYLCKWFYSDK